MNRYEKIICYGLLLFSLLCAFYVIGNKLAYGFPGNENLTSVTVSDARVNPSQYVVWNIPVLNNATSWVNITITYNATTLGPYNVTLTPTGNAIINLTAPANPGIYNVQLNTSGAIQNVTYTGFIVDLYNIDVIALYTEVEAGFHTLLIANGSSVIDGHELTDGDTIIVNGVTLDWNEYMDRFEGAVTEATPTIVTYNTLTGLIELTYGITNGNITTYPTVTYTTSILDLIIPYMQVGDWPGAIIEINVQLMGATIFWTFLLAAISLGIYNYAGAEVTIAAWILGWGTFATLIHGEANTIALIMIALAGGIYIAKFFLDRRTSV